MIPRRAQGVQVVGGGGRPERISRRGRGVDVVPRILQVPEGPQAGGLQERRQWRHLVSRW